MTSKEAVESILATGLTKYGLAKSLGAFPVSIDHWLSGVKMSLHYRLKMKAKYEVIVDDTV